MKFNCYYRGKDGSRQVIVINAINRNQAYQQTKNAGLTIIEILQSDNKVSSRSIKQINVKSTVNDVKIPNEDELKLLQMRRNAYWIGFVSAFFSPILWIVACAITFVKYEIRGLTCCITGIITPGIPIGLGLIGLIFCSNNPIVGCITSVCTFIVGIYLARYFYKKDVLLGFTIPTNTNKL